MLRALLICLLLSTSCCLAATHVIETGDDLGYAFLISGYGDTLILRDTVYSANPKPFTDSLCGNCLDPQTLVEASTGFTIRGKVLVVKGLSRTGSVLQTNAGYGLYIEDSYVEMSNLTFTGGLRDPDGNATDAAIVVRNSRVDISQVDIRDNDHRIDTVVVGIGGVFGREGAEITIHDCRIDNNGWDGVALYRGAIATVTDCLIKDGRGAGIGVTWDATCTAYRNEITGYWKGIGAFGSSWVIARNNLVHDNLGWGMIATGTAYMDMSNNVIHHNGNCGISPWSSECRGRIVNNIVTENGWREEWVCPCVGVANQGDWSKWEFRHNIVWNNSAGEYDEVDDQTGRNANLSVDPLFKEDGYYKLQDNSPAIHQGDSLIYNTDGTRSHIGMYGGPQAPK